MNKLYFTKTEIIYDLTQKKYEIPYMCVQIIRVKKRYLKQ